jgi:HSP20 family protein
MVSLRDAMDKLFEDSFIRPPRTWAQGVLETPVDMYQTENDVVVKAALPGVKADGVDIPITGDTLTIKGEQKDEKEVNEENYFYRERRSGSFQRTVTLPGGLDTSKAAADFEDGVLTLTIPRSEEQKPKQIQVKAKKTIEAPRK